jgi:hypothetical protein
MVLLDEWEAPVQQSAPPRRRGSRQGAQAVVLTRRSMLVGSALATAGSALGASPRTLDAAQLSFYMFVHTLLEPRGLGQHFETTLPDVSVWVLSRSADFAQIRERDPDAVLALSPVLAAHGFTPSLQGQRAGQVSEPYVVLSTGPVQPDRLRSVGAVDILGRRRMPEFVASLLGGNEPAVTPVVKLVDLLALLQLERVEAVVLPARDAGPLMSRTRLRLTETRLNGSGVGLPALCAVTQAGKQIERMLTSVPLETLQKIGVDSWR